MFTGRRTNNMDTKGRVAIPAKHRDVLRERYGSKLMLTVGIEGQCLWLYPMEEWLEFRQRLKDTGLGGRRLIRLQRQMFASAEALDVDKAGRVLLPENLCRDAGMEKEVMFVGMDSRIELWSPSAWDAEQTSLIENQDELLEVLDDVQF